MKTFKETKHTQMCLHSQLDRHHLDIVWQTTFLSATCVAECLNQKESNQHDKRKSSGAVVWASGSPSFVTTWMQKEPQPVSLRWVDIDKGDAGRANCRSRFVVRESKGGHEEI